MASDRVVRVVREVVACESGHWCNVCAKPSGVRMWVVFRLNNRMHLQDGAGCADCFGRDITLTDTPTPR